MYIANRNKLTDKKNTDSLSPLVKVVTRGERESGRGKLGVWD